MKEYTFRRLNFYALKENFDFPDEHKNFPIRCVPETTIEDAVLYLKTGETFLRFPGAARAVAIAAADLVSREFGEDFYEVLNDPSLMNNNDPYFVKYSDAKDVYDEIIKQCARELINWKSERMQITERLLKEEYMLDARGLELLSRWKLKP